MRFLAAQLMNFGFQFVVVHWDDLSVVAFNALSQRSLTWRTSIGGNFAHVCSTFSAVSMRFMCSSAASVSPLWPSSWHSRWARSARRGLAVFVIVLLYQ
jgi:hypothetical protein